MQGQSGLGSTMFRIWRSLVVKRLGATGGGFRARPSKLLRGRGGGPAAEDKQEPGIRRLR